MDPVNSSQRTSPPRIMSTNEVSWQNANVPDFDIKRGYSLTDIINVNLNELRALKSAVDISAVDFTSITNIKPESIDTALSILINAIVEIENTPTPVDTSTGTELFKITYNCLFNNQGIKEFHSNDEIIQAIVNKVCSNSTDITFLKNDTRTLNTSFQSLSLGFDSVVTQLNILRNWSTEALYSTEQVPLNTFLSEVKSDILLKNNKIGTVEEFDNMRTITGDYAKIVAEYGNNPAYNLTPNNAAEYLKNISIITFDMFNRILSLENNFSTSTCNDISVIFSTEFNSNRSMLTIRANASTGTSIPDDFVDNGSRLIISDGVNEFSKDIELTNNFIDVIDLTDTDLNLLVDYSCTIVYKFLNTVTGKECVNVSTKVLPYTPETSTTNINTTGTGSGYIEYYNPNTKEFNSFNLAPNMSYPIIDTASILMVIKTPDLGLNSLNASINMQLANVLPTREYEFNIRLIADENVTTHSYITDQYSIYKFNIDISNIELFINNGDLMKPDNSVYTSGQLNSLVNQYNTEIPRHLGEFTLIEPYVEDEMDGPAPYAKIKFKAPLMPVPPSLGLRIRNSGGVPGCTSCQTDDNISLWITSTPM